MPECALETLALRLRDGQGRSDRSRFALFLGAGASIDSGIPGTRVMMQHFREKLKERWQAEGAMGEFETWLRKQPTWTQDASDYSNLFETWEPTERGRARYIEGLVAKAEPSFGYFCLSQLVAQRYVDVVVTTNFDDLLYDACAHWTGVRPVVYAYGAPAGPVRYYPGRAAILKLHGDFLYSRLKNTGTELAHQDPNMETAVRRLLDEYEVIVVGYGGNDRSVVRLLEGIPNEAGLYWCVYRDEPVGGAAAWLLGRPNCFKVRTDGFAQVMDTFLNTVGFALPDLDTTLRQQREAIVRIISSANSPNKGRYLGAAEQAVRAAAQGPSKEAEAAATWLEHTIGAASALERGDTQEAIATYRQALGLRPDHPDTLNNLGNALSQDGQTQEAIATLRRALELRPDDPDTLYNLGNALSDDGQTQEAIATYRQALGLRPDDPETLYNLGNALDDDGQTQEAIATLRRALGLRPDDPDTLNSFGVALWRSGDREQAGQVFQQVVEATDRAGPDDVDAQMNRAIGLVGSGSPQDGIRLLQRLASRRPVPGGTLRNALSDLRPMAELGIEGAQECVTLIEQALSHRP